MDVMSPGTKNLQNYMINRLLVFICREFRAAEKRHLLPCIRADELPSQFPYLSEPFIRKKLKEHANFQVIFLLLSSFMPNVLLWFIIIFLFVLPFSSLN